MGCNWIKWPKLVFYSKWEIYTTIFLTSFDTNVHFEFFFLSIATIISDSWISQNPKEIWPFKFKNMDIYVYIIIVLVDIAL